MDSEQLLPEAAFPGTMSVLVVDDTAVVRISVFRMLSEAGYRVFEAGSSAEALEVLATARPPVCLALVDVVMPGVSGVDLVRLIHQEWPQTAILYMSAFPAEILVREGLTDPRVHFLAKPFTRDELVLKVAAVLASPLVHPPQEQSKKSGPRL